MADIIRSPRRPDRDANGPSLALGSAIANPATRIGIHCRGVTGCGESSVARHVRCRDDMLEDLHQLLEWDDLPAWQRGNVYVLTGYRRASPSHVASLRSIFRVRNETVNIWAHILGSGGFGLAGVGFWLRYAGGKSWRKELDQR